MSLEIRFQIIALLLFTELVANSQINYKQGVIDTSMFNKWPSVEAPKISNDGKYAIYTIKNDPLESTTMIVKALDYTWEAKIPLASSYNAFFNDDNSKICYIKNNTLEMIDLNSKEKKSIPEVSSFQTPINNKGTWIAYLKKNHSLIICNEFLDSVQMIENVRDYFFDKEGSELITDIEEAAGPSPKQSLMVCDLKTKGTTTIWTGFRSGNYAFNQSGETLAFLAQEKINNQISNSIWYYKIGMNNAIKLLDDTNHCIGSGLSIDYSRISFIQGGKYILFSFKRKSENTSKKQAGVDVWSYSDDLMQSAQLNQPEKSFAAALNVNQKSVLQLEHEDEKILHINGDFALVRFKKGDEYEWNWSKDSHTPSYLVFLSDGTKKIVNDGMVDLAGMYGFYTISPSDKYLVYFDFHKRNYFSYNLISGITTNITKDVIAKWTRDTIDNRPVSFYTPVYSTAWLADSSVLICDQNDIWQVDPSGIKKPLNLTNRFGRVNNIMFRIISTQSNGLIQVNNRLIVSAYNSKNKENGFYSLALNQTASPRKLTMGNWIFHWPELSFFAPIRSNSNNIYLLRRMSSNSAPNYLITKDFITFKSISNVQPQEKYNWYRAKLISWKNSRGNVLQGIIYKPQNFDSLKKYPVIINFYENKSDNVNEYLTPSYSEGEINIPWFVSQGYIVFTPDIKYIIGKTGESVVSSIMSAVHALSKMRWVNSSKIAIQAHSFGGYEVNYLITHTNLFAAAVSASGPSDLISLYGSGYGYRYGYCIQWSEIGQGRIGTSLWDHPERYIANSPIFEVNKVTTPILMMNNKGDDAVPFSQGVEFFSALRRLGKRGWMLQYDDGGHEVEDESALDFTFRMKQFFDHYLKDSACPRWMLYGIPAKDKGIDDGLQLVYEKDKNGKWLTPKEGGLLTDEEKKKVETLKHRKPVTITIE